MPKQPWFWGMAVLLWSAASAEARPQPSTEPMRLPPGVTKVINLPPGVRGFAIRDEELLQARPIGNRQLAVYVSPENQGDTRLLLFGPEGPIRTFDIRVRRMDVWQRVCDLCRFLPPDSLLELDIAGTTFMVRGPALSLDDARGVRLMRAIYPYIFVDVQLVDRALREALLQINHELWRAGFLDASAIVVGDRVVLTGRFSSSTDEARAHLTLAPYAEWLEDRLLPTPEPAP
ncbi:pilus assembly protein N-terminal domain-containing protein [Hyalangium versicolor]|uniref:pilus assembly protein N-terminal domain-containing protein n=1 Tax=Hyalangium versicolor TaxID=2861190 RepID=UPI001CCE1919|nr:pilus assembly protein N-terminal domain-containing protein [Hyalangium versicolor]